MLRELGLEVAVADISVERRAWAVERGIAPGRAFADFREALDTVDAVDIVTPADSHTAIAEACLKIGRHCFVENTVLQMRNKKRCTGVRAPSN